MKYTFILFISLCAIPAIMQAQLSMDLELRPRLEYRHGYKHLVGKNVDAATAISQRTRLKTTYNSDKLQARLTIQDVRVWGDVGQLNTGDLIGLSLHEAWAQVSLGKGIEFKVGRQEVSYDDQRIFGAVNWAQQARSHDMLKLLYARNNFRADIGLAFNQEREQLIGTQYNIGNQYKAMQFLWLHNEWEFFKASLLFLNNGRQSLDSTTIDKTYYSQTAGTFVSYNKNKFKADGSLYFQLGKDNITRDINAYLWSLNLSYQVTSQLSLGAGIEMISGNDFGVIDQTNKAFTPFYGTNHKFNGHMDYFYVGNHINSLGLIDINIKGGVKIGSKSLLNIAAHQFFTNAEYTQQTLGTEIDLNYHYKIASSVKLSIGYSHMIPSDGLKLYHGVTDPGINNWAWTMITINPRLFEIKKKEKAAE